MSPLLDQAFLDRLRHLLWRLARRRSGGGDRGRTARRPGGTHAFLGHRPYTPGDEPRRVDWHVFGRTGQLVVKVFGREEEETVDVLVDATASMGFGEPGKAEAARQLAAALAFLALHSRHRLRIGVLREGKLLLRGPFHGPAAAPGCFRDLDRVATPAGRDAGGGVAAYLTRVRRPGAVCLITDALERGTLDEALGQLGEAAGEASFFHVLSPQELNPDVAGLVLLRDAEEAATMRLEIDGALLRRYRRRLEALRDGLRRRCEAHGILYRAVSSAAPLETVVTDWYRARKTG